MFFRRFVIALSAMTMVASSSLPALSLVHPAPSTVQDSHHLNLGENDRRDFRFGEFGVDLGGLIPFERYAQPDHHWKEQYGYEVLPAMRELITDLDRLDEALRSGTAPYRIGLRLDARPDPAWHPDDSPVFRQTWWGTKVQVWKYDLNGGRVLIVRRNLAPKPAQRPLNILISNPAQHDSDRGTSAPRNDFDPDPEQFLLQRSGKWQWRRDAAGQPVLALDQQAVEAGDLVVYVLENQGLDLWTALLRTQEAERFVRRRFFADEIQVRYPEARRGRSFVHGGSWGGVVSGVLSLLQPAIYSASASSFVNDLGFSLLGIGDYSLLQRTHYTAAAGVARPDSALANRYLLGWPLLIDMLGIRFDGRPGARGWDLAAFSMTHRGSQDLRTPMVAAPIGVEDLILNWHWQREDTDHRGQPTASYLRNYGHHPMYGVSQGWQEYLHRPSDAWWRTVQAASVPVESNPSLVPSWENPPRRPEVDPYPDPYGHTLRADSGPRVTMPPLLRERDIHPESDRVAALGQGVWTGHLDSMRCVDLDQDGRQELVFGNLEGFVHVLEPRLDPRSNQWILVDEWKSPALGWGTWCLMPEAGGRSLLVGDHTGHVWRLSATGPNAYALQARPHARPDSALRHYPGPVLQMLEADLRGHGPETVMLGQHLDWVVRDSEGRHLATLQRTIQTGVPGHGTVCDLDGDGREDVLLPGINGHVSRLFFDSQAEDYCIQALGPCQDLSLYRLEVLNIQGTDQLLVFGRNDDLDPPDRVRVFSLESLSFQQEIELEVELRSSTLAHIGTSGMVALGSDRSVVLIDLTSHKARTVQLSPPTEEDIEVITSMRWIEQPASAGLSNNGLLAVATGHGTIDLYEVDETGLRPLRTARDVLGEAGGEELAWYSNRALGHVGAVDVRRESAGAVAVLSAAETTRGLDSSRDEFRVLELRIPLGQDVESQHLSEFVDQVPSQVEPRVHGPIHRAFRRADLDGNGQLESRLLAASGVFLVEQGQVRSFCNRRGEDGTFLPRSRWTRNFGGFLWERVPDPAARNGFRDYRLGGFSVPQDRRFGGVMFGGGVGFPRTGVQPDGGRSGMIASGASETWTQFYDGSSMVVAQLPEPGVTPPRVSAHIVTGTLGGYVYAIRPGAPSQRVLSPAPADPSLPSRLSYASDGLGLRAIGLAAGRLFPGDLHDTVVAGTWLDDGTFTDWAQGDPRQNRGELLILGIRPETGRFEVDATLHADDLMGPGRGLSSGVFGVAIDDVDADGTAEIWCGDAAGYLYLFRHGEHQNGQQWGCVYRSEDLGAYPGMYNKIFPLKGPAGQTRELIVKSPGYLMRFEVDADALR